jgi:hypothetical protein
MFEIVQKFVSEKNVKMEALNYRDLQKLAKNAGLRANLPKAELLRALQDHQQQNKTQDSNSVLNTTFEIDPDAEPVGEAAIEAAAVAAADGAATASAADISSDFNPGDESLMTEDGEGEGEKLNGTFEIIAEEDEREEEDSGRRRSNRLSVTGVSAAVLAKETANSPRLQGGKAGFSAARRIQVPSSRRSVSTTPRAVGSRVVGSGAVGSSVKKTAAAAASVPAVVQRLTTPSAVKRKAAEEGVSNIPRFVKFARSGSYLPVRHPELPSLNIELFTGLVWRI